MRTIVKSPFRRIWSRGILPAAALASLLPVGCGEPPALTVADASFETGQLLGLGEPQIDRLILITAIGTAIARAESERLFEAPLRDEREELLIELLEQEVTLEEAGIDGELLRAQYLEDPEPELVVRHLVILSERWRSSEHRLEARTRASRALDRARAGEPFGQLAGELSEEPGAEARGGLLAPGREGSWVREFWEAARALEVGEVSDVVETEYGFHVLRLDERRPVPFEEARPRLVARMAMATGGLDPDAWEARVRDWTGNVGSEGMGMEAEALRRQALLQEADRRNLRIAEPDEARLARAWERRVMGWAGAFGFQEGMTPEEVAEQALVALGRTDQDARIARESLARWEEPLRSVYSVQSPLP